MFYKDLAVVCDWVGGKTLTKKLQRHGSFFKGAAVLVLYGCEAWTLTRKRLNTGTRN